MAHEISIRKNGMAEMFVVGRAPWHGLGQIVDKAPTIEEAIKLAGLDWKVELQDLFTVKQDENPENYGIDQIDQLAPAKATVRTDTGEILGVVSEGYKILQNSEAFDFFQPFIDSKAVTLETAGALKQGKRIWVLAKVNTEALEVSPGDKVEMYVLLSNSHDGTMAIRVGFVPVRVVCNNTLTMAHNDKASKLIRIRHTGNPQEALQQVQEIINIAKGEFEATVDQYRAMAKKEINQDDLEQYVRVVFGLKSKENAEKDSKVVNAVKGLFNAGRGNDVDGARNTLWGAYNAIVEQILYYRGSSEDGRLDSVWFGTGAQLNKKALEVAQDILEEEAA